MSSKKFSGAIKHISGLLSLSLLSLAMAIGMNIAFAQQTQMPLPGQGTVTPTFTGLDVVDSGGITRLRLSGNGDVDVMGAIKNSNLQPVRVEGNLAVIGTTLSEVISTANISLGTAATPGSLATAEGINLSNGKIIAPAIGSMIRQIQSQNVTNLAANQTTEFESSCGSAVRQVTGCLGNARLPFGGLPTGISYEGGFPTSNGCRFIFKNNSASPQSFTAYGYSFCFDPTQ
jgi:hypothetical protein